MSSHLFHSKLETRAWIKSFAPQLTRPTVVLLSGEVGAGKTQFTRWFLEEFGVTNVASPTFAIHHRYDSAHGAIDHVDFYRVQDDGDLEASGFWDLLAQPEGLLFVEWADRLPPEVWPATWQTLHFEIQKFGEEGRSLEIRTP